MEELTITKKEYKKLYDECYKELYNTLGEIHKKYDDITTFEKTEVVIELNKFFKEKIYNKPIPFNDLNLFVELFKCSLSQPNPVKVFDYNYDILLLLYKDLNVNNELRKNIFKCFSILKLYNSVELTGLDVLSFRNCFKNEQYLFLVLSFIVDNINSIFSLLLSNTLDYLISIRRNYLEEDDYYKACICILAKVIKERRVQSIDKDKDVKYNELLIQEYNHQIELKENVIKRLMLLKERNKATLSKDYKNYKEIINEINIINKEIDKKVNNAILSQSESKLKEFNLKSLYEEIINSVDFKINLHTPYVEEIFKLILLEDKVNVNINLYDEEIKYLYSPMTMGSDCRTIARNLNLKYLQYNESNISDFMNLECFDLIINGGILIFYINHFEKDEQLELFNKLNKIKDYIYYNNQTYKVSDKLKILVISCTKEIEGFVTLDLEEPKAKRKIK